MILYLGNKLGKRQGNPTGVDYLGEKLSLLYNVISLSDARNPVFKLMVMIFAIFQFRKKSKVVLIDTYSTNAFWFAFFCGLVCQLCKIQYVNILRGGDLPKRLETSPWICRILFNKARWLIAPSGYLFQKFSNKGYTNVKLIPNHLDLDLYDFEERKVFRPKMIWVRAFHKIYNPLMALDVLDLLKRRFEDSKLIMVGPFKDESISKFREKVVEMKLEKDVEITGRLEKKEWLRISKNSDIFISTTNVDNTPVTLMEAMALGLAVVSTNPGGVPFLCENEVDSYLVDPGDVQKMVESISLIIEKPENVQKIICNAHKKVKSLGWDTVVYKWTEILDPLITEN